MCKHCEGMDCVVKNNIAHTVCMCGVFDKDVPIEYCNPYCCEYEDGESEVE